MGKKRGAMKSGGIVPEDSRAAAWGHWSLVSSAASLAALAGNIPPHVPNYRLTNWVAGGGANYPI